MERVLTFFDGGLAELRGKSNAISSVVIGGLFIVGSLLFVALLMLDREPSLRSILDTQLSLRLTFVLNLLIGGIFILRGTAGLFYAGRRPLATALRLAGVILQVCLFFTTTALGYSAFGFMVR